MYTPCTLDETEKVKTYVYTEHARTRTYRHCCNAVFNWNRKSGSVRVVLHVAFGFVEEPAVSSEDVPPVPKPLASDMVSRN